jgi:hypothetical protein
MFAKGADRATTPVAASNEGPKGENHDYDAEVPGSFVVMFEDPIESDMVYNFSEVYDGQPLG